MRKSEREAVIAHHEAGHAVIARKLGLEVMYVTLSRDNSSGVMQHQCATYFARNADTPRTSHGSTARAAASRSSTGS
jgi:hypothetical protein